MPAAVPITGEDLTLNLLAAVARDFAPVRIDPRARARIEAAAAVVEGAARDGTPVYGVTTGLGPRVVEPVAGAEATMFSLRTLRGRATAVGEPLDRELVRAAMMVRLNGVCAGGAGAGLGVAEGLAELLNAQVHPRIPGSGSVGASDLCLLAHVGLTLIGEGQAELGGRWLASAAALEQADLRPVVLGPKDGLAICSSSAVSVGAAALALVDAEALLQMAQVAAALSMEGFRANLSPLDPRVVAARPAPGQGWAAAGLRALLAGGGLADGSDLPRRLQDPLSFRCASQIHGSLRMALDLLADALAPELNGAADNPLVLIADGEILSTGNFHVPALALALDATAVGIAQLAAAATERQSGLKTERLSGLPSGLTSAGTTGSGLAPLTKTAQALTVEIGHLAAPLAVFGAVGADGVEDDSTNAVQAALRLRSQLQKLALVVSIELLVAAQAVDLAAPDRLGGGASAAYRCVRELVEPLTEDRAVGPDVERLAAQAVDGGALLERVRAAV